MPIPEFALPHTPAPVTPIKFPSSIPAKVDLHPRTVSIAAGKRKTVRKAKSLLKHTHVSVDWYESEDRTLPSVSSF